MKNEGSFMKKLQENVQAKMIPIAMKIDNQRHISALKGGLAMTIPVTVIGGIFLILASPPVNPKTMHATNIFFKFLLAWFAWATKNSATLMLPYQMTMGILGVYSVLGIAYFLAESYELNKINTAFCSFCIFLVVSVKVDGVKIDMSNLGAPGIFTAIVVGFLSVEITRLLRDKNISIKMPPQVPPMVAAPFEVLIPLVVNLLVFIGINGLLSLGGMSIPTLMGSILRPLLKASDSLPVILLLAFVARFLWFFGIHGDNIIGPLTSPISTANVTSNAAAVAAGKVPTAIFSGNFLNVYGAYCMLPALVIAMLIFSKSIRLKTLGKAAIVPDTFNINEPLTFGIPIVTNIALILPYLFIPLINLTIAYYATSWGLIGKFYILAPWTTPGVINAFLSSMDWRASVLYILLFLLDFIIWIPFIKSYDGLLLKREQEQ